MICYFGNQHCLRDGRGVGVGVTVNGGTTGFNITVNGRGGATGIADPAYSAAGVWNLPI